MKSSAFFALQLSLVLSACSGDSTDPGALPTGSNDGTFGTGGGESETGGEPQPGTPGPTVELVGAQCSTFGTQPMADAFGSLYQEWKSTQLVECGTTLRVQGCPAADDQGTCSEAMGYGMLLANGARDRDTFDRLNAYRHEMLLASSTADKSLMPWAIWNSKSCPPTAEGGDSNSATDADIDAAMALLQAATLYGDDGYRTEALTILASIMALEVEGAGASIKLKPGNHDGDNRDYVAYYTPAYFHVFAELTGDTRWTDLGTAFYTRLLANQCPGNGQIYDDFANPGECKFWWDSCRVPWRVALDYSWNGTAEAKTFLDTLHGFVGTSPLTISDQKNSAFVGAGVLSGLASDDPNAMQAMCNTWAGATDLDDSPYFQKTLRLLYLMVAGGNFPRP